MAIASKKSKRRKDGKGGRGGSKIGISIDAGSSTGGGCIGCTGTPPGIELSIEEEKRKRTKKSKKQKIKRGR